MKMKTTRCLLMFSMGLMAAAMARAQPQDADVSQWVLPVAEVHDQAFIRQFLEDQIINPEQGTYTSAVFLDVTQDGFGTNDLLVLQPSREQFLLSEYLPEAMLRALTALNLAQDYRLNTVRAQTAAITEEAEVEENPRKALAAALLRSVLPYYPAGSLEMHLRQRGEDVNITLWGYEQDLFQFVPQATQCVPPPSEPLMVELYAEPTIRTHLDFEGCVEVETWTAEGRVVSRPCN